MKYLGVVYDVGLRFTDEGTSVEPFDRALVEYDMRAIANDLHANAVRIEGEEIERLVIASRAARENGLAIFFNPWKMNVGAEATRAYLAEAAVAAEQLRSEGADIVFVTGCEYTIFCDGIFPGSSWAERGAWLGAQLGGAHLPNSAAELPPTLAEKAVELNKVLSSLAATVRASFHGPLTYSAGTWEGVDWSIFDIVGLDYYRRGQAAEDYISDLESHRCEGKPLGVLEVGCCTYEGAAAQGDGGFVVMEGVNPDGTGIWAGGVAPTRSEQEQADYVGTQLDLLAGADVDAVFVFVFSFPAYRTGEGAKDLDMASYALVKTFADDDPRSREMPPWEPKEAFHRAAEFFRDHAAAVPSAR